MTMPTMTVFASRPALLLRWALVSLAFFALVGVQSARANDADTTREAILNDPAAPVTGNPKGDLTIVSYFDYNCPYCKKSEPELERLIKADGKIRLVYKAWPILTEASVIGAQLVLAARYQDKFDVAHRALMGIPGPRIPAGQMREAIAASGVDMDRLDADLSTHAEEISALLRRNRAQAESLGFQGVPAYLIGQYRVTSGMNYDSFKKAAADARALAAKKK